jgi:hypothetical protein
MTKLPTLKILRYISIGILCASIILILLSSSGVFFKNDILKIHHIKINERDKIQISSEKFNTTEWLENPSFESDMESWFPTIDGDSSDINVSINQGEANIEILGSKGIFNLTEKTPSEDLWVAVSNPQYPSMPKDYSIIPEGWYVSHQWQDNDPQNPCIHWERDISNHIDMSDYIITSASVEAVVNATVSAYPGAPEGPNDGDGIEVPGDDVDNSDLYDYVRYYILISDVNKNNLPQEIAYYQTEDLGKDSAGDEDFLFDTFMIPVSEETLIFYLNQVLQEDKQNFTVCIGIRFWCEDNFDTYDEDNWKSIMIKNFSLIFTFEKKIDQFTYIAWNQISSRICDLSIYDIEVTNAIFNFKYKINQEWQKSSPNSEIRIFINNLKILETIKLIEYDNSPLFQYAKNGGFNVKPLISNDQNISVSIQVYLADQFELDHKIKISIDDISLEISYIEDIPTKNYSFQILWTVIIILIVIVGVLSVLSLRSYVFIPHTMRKKTNLILRTQKFKDVDNIQGILLIHTESGLPIFTKNFSNIMEGKKTLFSGFIQAISVVGDEISRKRFQKTPPKEPDNKLSFQKVIELDFKHFFSLILDIEELRTVLILKNKSSKRLKQQMFNFTLDTYIKISEQLKNWDNSLDIFKDEIPPLLNEYFDLYYKDYFKIAIEKSDLQRIRREFNVSKQEYRMINDIFKFSQEEGIFKLMALLEKMSNKDEDMIIDAIEALINNKLIIPANPIYFQD